MKKEVVVLIFFLILISSVYAVTYEFAGYASIYRTNSLLNTGTKACKAGFSSDTICLKVQRSISGVWTDVTSPSCGTVPSGSSSYRAYCEKPIVCIPNVYTGCSNADVYWYDSCNVMGSIKEDCGAGTCFKPAVGDAYCACANECTTAGSKRCKTGATNILQTCGNYDSDTCLEWSSGSYDSTCPTGQICSGVAGSAQCIFDSSQVFCGNNIVQTGEQCDQNENIQVPCSTINPSYTSGTATCNAPLTTNQCKWNLNNCVSCKPTYLSQCDNSDGCGGTRGTGSYNSCNLIGDTSCGTETKCRDYIDNNCDGESDYDSQDGRHGDLSCPVGISAISVPSSADANTQITVTCTSTVTSVNSVSATLGGSLCSYSSWSGNSVTFNCNTGSSAGTKIARCYIDTTKSYKSGTDKSANVNVQTPTCSTYTSSSTCPTATCDWCSQCSGVYSTKQADACVNKGSCPTRVCWKDQCGAACDSTQGGCPAGYSCNDKCACVSDCSASNCGACSLSQCALTPGCNVDNIVGSASYNSCIPATQSCGTPCNPWRSDCSIIGGEACCTVSGGTAGVIVPITVL